MMPVFADVLVLPMLLENNEIFDFSLLKILHTIPCDPASYHVSAMLHVPVQPLFVAILILRNTIISTY